VEKTKLTVQHIFEIFNILGTRDYFCCIVGINNVKTVTFTSTRFRFRKIKCRVFIHAQHPGTKDKRLHKIAIHNSKK